MATVGTFNGKAKTRDQKIGFALAPDNITLVQLVIDDQFSIPYADAIPPWIFGFTGFI